MSKKLDMQQSERKGKSDKKSASGIVHNFNPNASQIDQKTASQYQSGAHLGDNDVLLNNYLADAKSQKSKKSALSRGSRRSRKSNGPKMVSFRELREIQRQQEQSHMGPGTHNPLKPFGSDMNKVNFGSKYKFDPGKNPGPGQYEPTKAIKVVHPKSYETFIKDGRRASQVEEVPEAGKYDPDKGFGHLPQKMTLGGKYKFVTDSNPPPGYYDPERADTLVKPKSASYRQSTTKRSRPIRNENPDAGQYEPHRPFGESPQKMTWQGKYEFKPDSNPPPGLYDPDPNAIKPSSSKAYIKEDQARKAPKESNPDAGQYEPHKPFGAIPQKMTWQGKYKFVPDSNPPPGLYDPLDTQTKSKSPSARIVKGNKKDLFGNSRNDPAPGQYSGHLKQFGDLPQKMTWQGKYKFVPDSNPPPGLYDADVAKAKFMYRSQSAWIKEPLIEVRPKDSGPSPGQYESHLKAFGDLPQNMTWQGKYKFVPDSNPPPGLYEVDRGYDNTKPKSQSYSQSKERRDKKVTIDAPDAGQYNPDYGFGHIPGKMTLGGPYKWKPDDNPGPGTYEADKSLDSIKASSPSAKLHELLIPNKRSENPYPQVYDGHLKPFGADNKNRQTWSGKYKFTVNDVPPPGYYDPERGDSLTKSRSPAAKMYEETMVPLDPIPVYTRFKKSDRRNEREGYGAIQEDSESTPKPQMAPQQMEESTQSRSPAKRFKKQ